MEFAKIPKFTTRARYHVQVDLVDVAATIERYTKHYHLEMNPNFQRGHVWTEEQQIKFIEFLLRGGYSGQDIYFNCKGWMNHFDGPMYLVDGLQRLTAALRFLNNEISVFGAYFREYDRVPSTISFNFHVNDLSTYAEVLQWYIELNEGGVVHTPEEIARVKKMLADAS